MTDNLHQRARAVFLELSTLDGPVANSELDRLVGNDPALRAAVVSLLDARQDANDAGLMTAETATHLSAPITESAGTIIGPYKILQVIGEGGFGTVFLAEQAEPVRRRVALKIIKLGMDTKQVIARFEAERQALALMDHPHIARVFDAGSTDSGRPYFAMEYVVGDAITKFADAYKLEIPARLVLFAQICSAVQHAHTKGVIHRDLKPANVLVSMVDGKPFAKVIDFGIAKATASPLTEKTLFTEHRQLIGTPEYMSPEQADGSPDIDTRTDVYALGVLLYEILTGATPFDAKRLRSAAWDEMQRIIREEEPPAPSLRLSRDLGAIARTAAARGIEPTRLSTAVRGELDWVVMKALEKERARRYETPAQFAEDVGRHLRGEPVAAAPPSRVYKAKKFVRRNKGPVIAGGAVAATLLIGMAGTAWGWREAIHSRAETANQARKLQDAIWMIAEEAESNASDGGPAILDAINPENLFPGIVLYEDGGFSGGPSGDMIADLRDTTIWYLQHATRARQDLRVQTDTAEWSAYTANLALAQTSMDAGDWPAARRYLAECPESKRGWEWTLMQGHAQSVAGEYPDSNTAVSPDGSKVISIAGRIVTVSTADGTPITEYRLDYGPRSNSCIFSDDGSTAVLGTDDPLGPGFRAVVLSTSADGDKVQRVFPGLPTAVSSNGSMIVVADAEDIKIYSRDGSLLRSKARSDVRRYSDNTRFVGGDTAIADLAYNAEGSLSLWSIDTGEVKFLTPASGGAEYLSSSPDGQHIAAAFTNGIAVWDTNGQLVFESDQHGYVPRRIVWSEDGTVLVTLSYGATLVWSIDGKLLATVPNDGSYMPTVAVSADGLAVALALKAGVRLVNTRSGDTSFIDASYSQTIERAYTPDAGRFVYSGDTLIRVVTRDGELAQEGSVDSTFSAIYAVSHEAGFVWHWDMSSGPSVVRLPLRHTRRRVRWDPERCSVYAAAITGTAGDRAAQELMLPDGSRRISADRRMLRFTDTATDRTVLTLPLEDDVASLALSPRADRLVVTFVDGTLEVLDTRPVEVQQAAIAEENARRNRVRPFVQSLLDSEAPTTRLSETIASYADLSPAERHSAYELLVPRLLDIERDAQSAVRELTGNATSTEDGRALVGAADMPRRVHHRAMELAEAWEYHPPEVTKDQQIAEETNRRRLAEAWAAIYAVDLIGDPVQHEQMRAKALDAIRTFREMDVTYDMIQFRNLLGSLTTVARGVDMYMWAESAMRTNDLAYALNLILETPLNRVEAGRFDGNTMTRMYDENDSVTKLIQSAWNDATPCDLAVCAMIRYRLSQAGKEQLNAAARVDQRLLGRTMSPTDNLTEAHRLLREAIAIMKNPEALNDAGLPWAEDLDAISLIEEAESFINNTKTK